MPSAAIIAFRRRCRGANLRGHFPGARAPRSWSVSTRRTRAPARSAKLVRVAGVGPLFDVHVRGQADSLRTRGVSDLDARHQQRAGQQRSDAEPGPPRCPERARRSARGERPREQEPEQAQVSRHEEPGPRSTRSSAISDADPQRVADPGPAPSAFGLAVSPSRAIRSACLRAAVRLNRASSFPGSRTSASSKDQIAGPTAPEREIRVAQVEEEGRSTAPPPPPPLVAQLPGRRRSPPRTRHAGRPGCRAALPGLVQAIPHGAGAADASNTSNTSNETKANPRRVTPGPSARSAAHRPPARADQDRQPASPSRRQAPPGRRPPPPARIAPRRR